MILSIRTPSEVMRLRLTNLVRKLVAANQPKAGGNRGRLACQHGFLALEFQNKDSLGCVLRSRAVRVRALYG